VYTDYARFLKEGHLDAVVVATGVGKHYSMCKASLLAGKHTCVEKPMATSSAECEELNQLARKQGLVLMVGHTFLFSPIVRRIKKIVDDGDIGEIRYISARRLNLGLFQKDINVTWDLAPHDLSIILHIMQEMPVSVNCRGGANVNPNIADVTTVWLSFSRNRSATIHSSWLDPRKTREMTIVGSKRMIVYDDVANQDKIRIFDARVESPPHYDTFAEFHYAYHYGDIYVPYVKQEEPLKLECQHFLDCIRTNSQPLTDARQARNVVQILEASAVSLSRHGAPVSLAAEAGNGKVAESALPPAESAISGNGHHEANGPAAKNGAPGRRRTTRVPKPQTGVEKSADQP
jgi:predicted dehydrogenase